MDEHLRAGGDGPAVELDVAGGTADEALAAESQREPSSASAGTKLGSALTVSNSPSFCASACAMLVSRLLVLSNPAVRNVIVVTTTCSWLRRAPSSSAAIMALIRSSPGCSARAVARSSSAPRSLAIAATWGGSSPSDAGSRVKKSSSQGRIRRTSSSVMPNIAPRTFRVERRGDVVHVLEGPPLAGVQGRVRAWARMVGSSTATVGG